MNYWIIIYEKYTEFLNIMERSSYWYIGSLLLLSNTYTTAFTTKQVVWKMLLTPCLYPIINNKDDFTKKHTRIKQALK